MDKPLVLLADDNDATCALVSAILQRDFVIDVATDGLETVEKLRVRDYSAVLLDLRMPHIDGIGVLEFLRDERSDLLPRVLVLTASLTKPELERVHEFPIAGIIAKPFEVETLLGAVRQCASGSGRTHLRGHLFSSGVILLLADILRSRWM